jgi:hypothetical protein
MFTKLIDNIVLLITLGGAMQADSGGGADHTCRIQKRYNKFNHIIWVRTSFKI